MHVTMREPRCAISNAVVEDIAGAGLLEGAAFALAVGQIIIGYLHGSIVLKLVHRLLAWHGWQR